MHLNGAASDASLVEAPPPLYIHLGRLISAKKVPRRSGAIVHCRAMAGWRLAIIAVHRLVSRAWFLAKKNVLLTGAAGNMALFYDAQIDIRAVRP